MPDNGEDACAAAMIECLVQVCCRLLCELGIEMCFSGDCNCCSKSADRNVIDYERGGVVLEGEEEAQRLLRHREEERGPLVPTQKTKYTTTVEADGSVAVTKQPNDAVRGTLATGNSTWRHTHRTIGCDECYMKPLVGTRYSKVGCKPSYDLCEADFNELSEDDRTQYEIIAKMGDPPCGSPLSAPFCGECGARSGWARATPAVAAPGRALSAPPPYGPPQSAQYE
eukprot:gene20987-1989_t